MLVDWSNTDRLIAKAVGSKFALRPGEFALFDDWWKLMRPARQIKEKGPLSGPTPEDETEEAFTRLAGIVNDGAGYKERGYRYVRRMPGKGRFVIFSDHHMAFAGSRQDFFRTSGNSDLYGEILAEYAGAGFTLIENGDVEELLIHEPAFPPPQPQLSLQEKVGNLRDIDDRGWEALDALRVQNRLPQLENVIANHKALYEQINRQFVKEGRYIRLAGNHDQDLQDAGFLEVLRAEYPDLEQVYDFLILEPEEASGPTYVIGHGHHFDEACTPRFARRLTETIAECLGWAYEGADRVWRWDIPDGVKDWANGKEAFRNNLVRDEHDPHKLTFGDWVETGLVAFLTGYIGLVTLGMLGSLGGIVGMAASLVDELSDPAFWETTLGSNIAWEYFRSRDPAEAIFEELFCGERWTKLRHLDEVFIHDQLKGKFGSRPPYLVLGHSHEPRHRALNPDGSIAEHYLNGGAAGRFQNLIWGVEIIDGVPQVVAWHRPGGPESREAPERRTYTPIFTTEGLLVPSSAHVPLPPAEAEPAEMRRWLEPVLHVMMGAGP
jgi:hypothetical protein